MSRQLPGQSRPRLDAVSALVYLILFYLLALGLCVHVDFWTQF